MNELMYNESVVTVGVVLKKLVQLIEKGRRAKAQVFLIIGRQHALDTLSLRLCEALDTFEIIKLGGFYKDAFQIADVRVLRGAVSLKPVEGKSRLIVMSGAEHMAPVVANALLKFLEEPPSRNYILLMAEDDRRVLATIKSRATRISLDDLTVVQTNHTHVSWQKLMTSDLSYRFGISEVLCKKTPAEIVSALESWMIEARGRAEALKHLCRAKSLISTSRMNMRSVLDELFLGTYHSHEGYNQ